MQDSRKFTVLTYSAYKNDTNCFKILFEYAFKTSSKHEMNAWANQTTDDQFTALHFASFFGNYEMIEYLILHGANPYATNDSDINMLHVGA